MTFVIGVRTGHSIETETTTLIESPDQDDLSGNELVPVLRATSTYSAFCTLRGVGGVRRLSRSSRHLESLRSELTDHRRAIVYRTTAMPDCTRRPETVRQAICPWDTLTFAMRKLMTEAQISIVPNRVTS
jgi:hypothetical protein